MKHHKKPIDDNCSVCKHKDCGAIEDMYVQLAYGGKIAPLARMFKVPPNHLKVHMEALGFAEERVKNTYGLMHLMISAKLEEGDLRNAPWGEIVKLMKHIDVREGRVVHKVQDEHRGVIRVIASPSPGAQLPPARPLLSSGEENDVEDATFTEE